MSEPASKLKPCPFCGGPAELDSQQSYKNITTGNLGLAAAIYCPVCPVNMSLCYEDMWNMDADSVVGFVIGAWNTRNGVLTDTAKNDDGHYEDGWWCSECDKPYPDSHEGVAFDNVIYCSDACVEARKASL